MNRRLIVDLLSIVAVVGLLIWLIVEIAGSAKRPDRSPTEQAAADWGREHIGDSVTAVCHAESCMVWATLYGYRGASATTPPILLTCAPACVPDLQRSVTAPKETP